MNWRLTLELNFTDTVLLDANNISLRIIKKTIRGIDREKLAHSCRWISPTIADIASRCGSWAKLWDSDLHLGSRNTIGLQNLHTDGSPWSRSTP